MTSIFELQRSDCDESDISILNADRANELIMENRQLSNDPERYRDIAREIAENIPISKLRYNSLTSSTGLLNQR